VRPGTVFLSDGAPELLAAGRPILPGAINPIVRSVMRTSTIADCQATVAQTGAASTGSDTGMRSCWGEAVGKGCYEVFSSRLLLSAPQVATQNGTV
jgi:hypothetical protein